MKRSSRRSERLAHGFLLSLLTVASGCSYAFVHGPPHGVPASIQPESGDAVEPPTTMATCTTSNALPILDTVGSILLFGAAGVAYAGAVDAGKCTDFCITGSPGAWIGVGAAATGLGVLLLSSAVTGYGRTADCRRTQTELPAPPHPSARYLLEVSAIAEARARPDGAITVRTPPR
jgi:hypothetical protein